jgi:hypothetical protein
VGLGLLMKKQESVLTLASVMKLNELTLEIFGEYCDYIYVKNKEYENIRNECVKAISSNRPYNPNSVNIEEWVHDYNEKECRYLIKNLNSVKSRVSEAVRSVVSNLDTMTPEEHWSVFISRYPLIELSASEALIKVSLREKGVPTSEADLN